MIATTPSPVPYLNPAFDPNPPTPSALKPPDPSPPQPEKRAPKKPKPPTPPQTSPPNPETTLPETTLPESTPPKPTTRKTTPTTSRNSTQPKSSPPPKKSPPPKTTPTPTRTPNPAHELGRRGEDLVAKYVQTRGLILLCRNWRCREGEIDILATDGHMLVVCEVKTRTTNDFGTPADAMSAKKIRCIRAATNRWLREFHVPYVPVRYDLAEVWWPTTGKPHLQYRRDAF